MIDKLDFQFETPSKRLSAQLTAALGDRRTFAGRSPIRPFHERLNLQIHGRPYFVHQRLHDGFLRSFRIELKELGRWFLPETLGEIGRDFGIDVLGARVQRVDLAVDIPTLSMSWVRDHMRVFRKKRDSKQYKRDCDKKSESQLEGMTFGKRPNLIRVYDKRLQLLSVKRRNINGALIRFERQYGGKLPDRFESIGGLLHTVRSERPFASVKLDGHAKQFETALVDGFTGIELLTTAGYLCLQSKLGNQELTKRLGSNRKRIVQRMEARLQTSPDPVFDLDELFQESISEQLARSTISMHKLSA